jgi:hypothetical protein
MSVPRTDADCRICTYKRCCGKYVHNIYDVETGKPDVDCYGYEKEMTEEDIKNSTWNN